MNEEATMRRAHFVWLAMLVLGALFVRLLWALKFGENTGFGDEAEYIDGARRLLAGEPLARPNWMYFIRAPGYSCFLAAVWMVVGHESRVAVRIAQSIISTAACPFLFALARRLRVNPVAALVATAFACFHPYLVYMVAALGTEGVLAFFVASGTYYLVCGLEAERNKAWRLVLSGLLLGLGNLLRPNLQTILPAVAVWLMIRYRRQLREAITALALITAPVVVLAMPWTLAVERAGYGWVWVTNGAGVWYYMGHNDLAYTLFCTDQTAEQRQRLIRIGEPELMSSAGVQRVMAAPVAERQKMFWRVALEWDRTHLRAQPCLAVTKLYSFWRPWVNRDAYPLKVFLVSLASAPTLILGLWGSWLAWRGGQRTATVFTWIVAATSTFIAVVFSTELRYRVPMVDVLLVPFVGMVVHWALARVRREGATV